MSGMKPAPETLSGPEREAENTHNSLSLSLSLSLPTHGLIQDLGSNDQQGQQGCGGKGIPITHRILIFRLASH